MSRWKRHERTAARAVGLERNPNTGKPYPDFDDQLCAYQHKCVRAIPTRLRAAIEQAVRDADGRVPVVVVTVVRQGVKAERFAWLRYEDWCALHGSVTEADDGE